MDHKFYAICSKWITVFAGITDLLLYTSYILYCIEIFRRLWTGDYRLNTILLLSSWLNLKTMESTRLQKISRLLQKDLGEILQRLDKDVLKGKMVSVTVVRVSPDLSLAKVYLSVFPSENGQAFVDELRHHIKHIRNVLGQRVRNQLRIVPELAFFIDDSLDYVNHIDELLKK
jgi:ribosome-binding factor A